MLRSLDDRLHSGRKLTPFFLRCSKEMLKLERRWAYALSSCGGIIIRWLTFRGRVIAVYDVWHRSRPGIVYCLTGGVSPRACVCEIYDRYLRHCFPHLPIKKKLTHIVNYKYQQAA